MQAKARPPGGGPGATIRDVAERAGVGTGTVSRVLNGHPAVTDATRARVLEAIQVLDYHPSRIAQALSRRRVGSVAVVVPLVTHPSAVERMRGVLDVLEGSGVEVVLYNIDPARAHKGRLSRLARGDVADGLLLISMAPTPDEAEELRARRLPTVVIDADTADVPSFVVDDVHGGQLAGAHLLGLGHARIGYIGDTVSPEAGFTSSARRRSGLALELGLAGHPLDPELVREGTHGFQHARAMAYELLTLSERPTAVFAHSDTQALGLLDAATSLGLRVPEDLSVVGFDDLDAARHVGLTTVRQPLHESGRRGASLLLALLAGAEPTGRVELPLELVVRRTTGPAPGSRGAP